MTIGEFIRQRRRELNLSADDVARMIGKNRATVYRYESNYIESLPADILVPLAKALRVTPGDLIKRNGDYAPLEESFPLSPHEKELVTKYRALDERGREMVDATLELQYKAVHPRVKKDGAAS